MQQPPVPVPVPGPSSRSGGALSRVSGSALQAAASPRGSASELDATIAAKLEALEQSLAQARLLWAMGRVYYSGCCAWGDVIVKLPRGGY